MLLVVSTTKKTFRSVAAALYAAAGHARPEGGEQEQDHEGRRQQVAARSPGAGPGPARRAVHTRKTTTASNQRQP